MSLLWRTATSEYSYVHEPDPSGGVNISAIHTPTGREIGIMLLSHPYSPKDLTRTIQGVGVDEGHRRRGVASGMLDYAHSLGLTTKHSSPAGLTPDGEAWSKAVDKRRPSTNVHDSSDYPGGASSDSGGSGSLS